MTDLLFQPDDEPTSGRFARVVVERGIDNDEGLTYSIPRSLADLRPGTRVRVPLGRGNTLAEGYVVSVADSTRLDPSRIKPIRSIARADQATDARALPPTTMELARWMAGYYCCPLGMVLASMIPAAVKKGTGLASRVVVEPTGAEPLGKLPPATRAAWEYVRALNADAWPIAAKDLAAGAGLSSVGPVNRLIKAGLLRERRESFIRTPLFQGSQVADRPVVLNDAQREAVDQAVASLGTFAPFLLYGITGSGKTEVYLRILAEVVSRGGSAIVLVPEISLTPQTVARFSARFGGEEGPGIAVLHSGLTAAQRHREWSRIGSGDARIVIGARSAVFAPVPGEGPGALGVVIVDEEHDGSYKQDRLPRYNARDVAVKLAQIHSCPVVLGSATPSLESWHNAQQGRFRLLRLPERVGGGRLPEVRIVDLEAQREQDGKAAFRAIGKRLEAEMRRTLGGAGQVILLLNRRGYSNYLRCASRACDWTLGCEHCDATLVLHKTKLPVAGGAFVKCHHCLAQQRVPSVCPLCRSKVIRLGFGTQRVEEEILSMLPDLAGEEMIRLDSDAVSRAAEYFDALERFRSGRARILLGTQMVAKGLDFPNVELIGVINADTAMGLPDFRASERTFQLVAQVAGRAGRSAASGASSRVIVQTVNPDEPAIRLAARHDYESFARRELRTRFDAALPPATRMARIVCRDTNSRHAEDRARSIADALRAVIDDRTHVEGPMRCTLARIADHFRFAVEITAPDAARVRSALEAVRRRGLAKSDARTAIDVDPLALL